MNNTQTLTKMREMRLAAMAQTHQRNIENQQHNELTHDEYLALLVDYEWEHRQNKRIERLTTQARFRQQANITDIDYQPERNLDKNMFSRLANLGFIAQKENVIITGASGTGKSFLAQALGQEACQTGNKVIYTITSRMFNRLKLAKADGTYLAELKKITNAKVLVLDDFGLQSFDIQARESLMDIIDDRYSTSSTIVVSQIPVSKWYDLIGEGTLADAILDRLVHSSHRIELKGESMRKAKKVNTINKI